MGGYRKLGTDGEAGTRADRGARWKNDSDRWGHDVSERESEGVGWAQLGYVAREQAGPLGFWPNGMTGKEQRGSGLLLLGGDDGTREVGEM